jgi:LEA14-like dessication related protein
MKKLLIPLLVILLLALVLGTYLLINWKKKSRQDPYATFIKPRLELSSFAIKTMSKEQITMDMKYLIDNPAPIGFTAEDLQYKIFIAGQEVTKSSYAKTISLKGNDSSLITLPLTIYTEKLTALLEKLDKQNADSVEYKIEARLFTDIAFLQNKPIDLEFAKVLPLYKIPEAKLQNIKLEKLGLNRTKLLLTAEVENPNVFPYKFKDTAFQFNIDKDKVVEGTVDKPIVIPPRQKEKIEIPVEIDVKEVGQTAFNLLFKPEEVDYYFIFRTKLIADKNTIKDSKVVMEDQGKLKELVKVLKGEK